MNNTKNTIEIEWHQYGQSGAYTDSHYIATIRTTENGKPRDYNKEVILKYAKALVRDFEDKPANWASSRLVSCSPVGKLTSYNSCAEWRVDICQPYTD